MNATAGLSLVTKFPIFQGTPRICDLFDFRFNIYMHFLYVMQVGVFDWAYRFIRRES